MGKEVCLSKNMADTGSEVGSRNDGKLCPLTKTFLLRYSSLVPSWPLLFDNFQVS